MKSPTLLKTILVFIFLIGFTSNAFAGPMDDLLLNGFIKNDASMVNKAISNGANNVNYLRDDQTPLTASVRNRNASFVEWLIKNGANVNFKKTNWPNETVLILAADANELKIIQLLVNAGAFVNDTDRNGKTALFFVLYHNNLPATEFLISKGADVNWADQNGTTPLMYISNPYLPGDRKVKIAIAKSLLKAGADPGKVNPKNMKTALQIAIDNNYTEMVDLLLPISPK